LPLLFPQINLKMLLREQNDQLIFSMNRGEPINYAFNWLCKDNDGKIRLNDIFRVD
jgi:Ca2+-binding EF-hand superfamily protein